jgi:hypothetical protein
MNQIPHSDDPADERVGKGRPPKKHRFKPGRSGNPGGRPTGSRNFRKMFEMALNRDVEITCNGEVLRVATIEAILMAQVREAMRGDVRAGENLLSCAERLMDKEETVDIRVELPEDDEAILARALRHRSSDPAEADCGSQARPDRVVDDHEADE